MRVRRAEYNGVWTHVIEGIIQRVVVTEPCTSHMDLQTVAVYGVAMARLTVALGFDPQDHGVDLLGAGILLGVRVYAVGVCARAGLLLAARLFQGDLWACWAGAHR